jgi:hypothetical protein
MSHDNLVKVLDCLTELGWNPTQIDHEDANGQFEINWEYDDCLVSADRHVFFKFMVKVMFDLKPSYSCRVWPKGMVVELLSCRSRFPIRQEQEPTCMFPCMI